MYESIDKHLRDRERYHNDRLSGKTLVCFTREAQALENAVSRSALLELKLIREFEARQVLTEMQWAALKRAEDAIYTRGYELSYTDVHMREDSANLIPLWEQAEISIMSEDEKWDDHPRAVKDAMIARRVARAWAVCVFGPEFIMK